MGTGTGMRQLSPEFAAPASQGDSPIPGGMPSGMSPGMMSGPMMGMSPDPLAQEVLVAQWQVDQALARYQQTEDETERQAIKADLTTALERQFEIQQQRRMNELAEIENRVQKLRELIEKRNQAKQTIVSKRCDQLLSELDGLGWMSPAEGVPPAGSEGMPGMGMGAPGMMGGSGMMTPGGGMPGMGGMPSGSGAGSFGIGGYGSSSGGPEAPPSQETVDAVRDRAERESTSTHLMNNLKQIGLAMHNYHDVHRTFPPAYQADASGRPLLSWRVLILPYLEQDALYREFHLDEPWDSDHNKKLIERIPAVYQSPGSAAGPGKTNYLTVRGPNTIFPGKDGVGMSDITDGTANTVLVVEASDQKAVVWTKPDDLEYNDADPAAGIMGLRREGFLATLCDGSAILIRSSLDSEVIRCLFLRNDGKSVPPNFGTAF